MLTAAKTSTLSQHSFYDNKDTQAGRLRLSAVVNEEQYPYDAKIECWELDTSFHDYPTIGASLPLADVSNLTYVTLPPKSAEGLHHPPHHMLFILLAGLAHVTLPSDPMSAGLWIMEGLNPVIVATDTLGVGHNTSYPSNKTTIALQAPFKDGMIPEHIIVAQGPCAIEDTSTSTFSALRNNWI